MYVNFLIHWSLSKVHKRFFLFSLLEEQKEEVLGLMALLFYASASSLLIPFFAYEIIAKSFFVVPLS
jgi:hypothetical protein